MKHLSKAFRVWIPLAVLATLLAGLVYASVQYSLRSGADDPQIQIAEDAAYGLEKGVRPSFVLPPYNVEISRSLAPYVIIFNSKGDYLASSATLDGKPPLLPVGVFTHAQNKGIHKVTWQPRPGVRSAVVIVPFKGRDNGFVVAGRSLTEVEKREDREIFIVGLSWAVTLIVTLAAVLVVV